MITVSNLSVSYGNLKVLDNISFTIEKGTLSGLLGPNGAGKSTLFKSCLNFIKADSGDISVDGVSLADMPPSKLAKLISYVPQEHRPHFPFTVKDIVLMGRSPYMKGVFGLDKDDYRIANEAMELMDIIHLSDKPCNQLSGGQRQLVFIARAVAQETPIMFLDEPTSALDFDNQIKTWKVLKQIVSKGVTVLACSHDPNHILWFSDNIIALNNGELKASGRTGELLNTKLISELFKEEYLLTRIDDKDIIYPKL